MKKNKEPTEEQLTRLDQIDWSSVINDNAKKPDDNATEGAKAGTNLKSSADVVLDDPDVIKLMETFYGDGSDGDVTISSDTTLTSDMAYNNLTINAGVTLNPNGYRIFVKGTLTNNGIIARNGNDGIAGTGNGGTGGAALADNNLGGSGVGGGDGTGGSLNGGSVNPAIGKNGGQGGNGSYGVGSAGVATAPSFIFSVYPFCVQMNDFPGTTLLKGGAGGGCGGNDGTGGHDYSGGGGSGGGVMVLVAKTIINGGTISVNGGNGANAAGIYDSGGGGGGGGGCMVLIYNSLTNTGTISASGGTGGAGAGSGGIGANGNAGTVIYLQV